MAGVVFLLQEINSQEQTLPPCSNSLALTGKIVSTVITRTDLAAMDVSCCCGAAEKAIRIGRAS